MTAEHLRRLYQELARHAEADRPLWQAVVLSGAMDPVRSPDMRQRKECALGLLQRFWPRARNAAKSPVPFPSRILRSSWKAL